MGGDIEEASEFCGCASELGALGVGEGVHRGQGLGVEYSSH
jgi:hypothetical protein